MKISGHGRVAGVIGWPVSHSLSPRLHGYWLDHYGIDGAYIPMAVRPDDLSKALRALPVLGMRGANITIPHKQGALIAVDRADDDARKIGAVNTVVVLRDGSLLGRNTDGYGFLENLRLGHSKFDPALGPATVLGAGGAVRAIVAALIDSGAPEIRIVNRTHEHAEDIARSLGGPTRAIPQDQIAAVLSDAALFVNGTSLGMTGQPPLSLDMSQLSTEALVTDIVYEPLETPLLAWARARGNPVVDGLGMLLHQARPGFEAWFGVKPDVTDALRAAVIDPKSR